MSLQEQPATGYVLRMEVSTSLSQSRHEAEATRTQCRRRPPRSADGPVPARAADALHVHGEKVPSAHMRRDHGARAARAGTSRYLTITLAGRTTVLSQNGRSGMVRSRTDLRGRYGLPLVAYDSTAGRPSADGRTLVLSVLWRNGFPVTRDSGRRRRRRRSQFAVACGRSRNADRCTARPTAHRPQAPLPPRAGARRAGAQPLTGRRCPITPRSNRK